MSLKPCNRKFMSHPEQKSYNPSILFHPLSQIGYTHTHTEDPHLCMYITAAVYVFLHYSSYSAYPCLHYVGKRHIMPHTLEKRHGSNSTGGSGDGGMTLPSWILLNSTTQLLKVPSTYTFTISSIHQPHLSLDLIVFFRLLYSLLSLLSVVSHIFHSSYLLDPIFFQRYKQLRLLSISYTLFH